MFPQEIAVLHSGGVLPVPITELHPSYQDLSTTTSSGGGGNDASVTAVDHVLQNFILQGLIKTTPDQSNSQAMQAGAHLVAPVPTLIMVGDGGSNYNYGMDFGLDSFCYSDSNSYFGDYGNYDNRYDVFDSYTGVDSISTTTATAVHTDASTPSSYFVYSQTSGALTKVVNGITTSTGSGYAGNQTYYNNPNAQPFAKEGPLPQGEYNLGTVDNHKGPVTIELSPDSTNQMFGRNNFLIHGDNSSLNHTASEGCIILGHSVRDAIVASGIVKLYVIH